MGYHWNGISFSRLVSNVSRGKSKRFIILNLFFFILNLRTLVEVSPSNKPQAGHRILDKVIRMIKILYKKKRF
jgi:hypothetical protein